MSDLVYRLTKTHQRLDDAIRTETKRLWPDSIRLLRLRKLKLAVKDRIAGLMRPKKIG